MLGVKELLSWKYVKCVMYLREVLLGKKNIYINVNAYDFI